MTRGAAISMALLALIAVALIVLLAWPTHSAEWITPKAAASREVWAIQFRGSSNVADWRGPRERNFLSTGMAVIPTILWQRRSVDDSLWPLWLAEDIRLGVRVATEQFY
jgi:hypothetical protein